MLKKRIILLFFCLLCICLTACGDAPDTAPGGSDHTAAADVTSGGKQLVKIIVSSGNDETITYDCTIGNGTITLTSTEDSRIRELVYEYDPAGYQKPFYWEAYYDNLDYPCYPKEIGNPISSLTYEKGGEAYADGIRYEYQDYTKRAYYIENGVTVKLEESEHDKNGVAAKMTVTDEEDHTLASIHTYLCYYDAARNTVKVNDGGSFIASEDRQVEPDNRWIEMTYTPTGKLDTISEYHDGECVNTVIYTYDSRQNVIKKEIASDHALYAYLAGYTEYSYDETGHMTGAIQYAPDGSVTEKTEYIYG